MKDQKYHRILYFISFVILLTLGVQGYWAYKTYNAEKQDLIADVQSSLDVAVDTYYTQLAQKSTFRFLETDSIFIGTQSGVPGVKHLFNQIDSLTIPQIKGLLNLDSIQNRRINLRGDIKTDSTKWRYALGDSISVQIVDNTPFEMLTSKIVISISEDEFSLLKLDSIFYEQLDRKQLWIIYGLEFVSLHKDTSTYGDVSKDMGAFSATAASSFLMPQSKLTVYFNNTTPLILHRNAVSLILTFILIASIIGILLYLLKIIKDQKQLAEIKNDLISNITHEFKTPLATISVALEGIEQFNQANDRDKTRKYIAMSGEQVKKLTHMVDKLLETASLDSQNLALNKKSVDLVSILTKSAIVPEAFIHTQKQISFKSQLETCIIQADQFHLENVIHTLIDNAFKYGGSQIYITLDKDQNNTFIKINDTGMNLTKFHATRIFDKFYRVPTGNHHDTKGFGIGLYYAKNIVEKHDGELTVSLSEGTTFTINLPNE